MERFQKYSARVLLILALLWLFLPMDAGYKYIYLGALILYVGVQNLVFLNIGQRSGKMPPKIAHLIERHGNEKGMMIYALLFVLFFILAGIGTIYSGVQMQFYM